MEKNCKKRRQSWRPTNNFLKKQFKLILPTCSTYSPVCQFNIFNSKHIFNYSSLRREGNGKGNSKKMENEIVSYMT